MTMVVECFKRGIGGCRYRVSPAYMQIVAVKCQEQRRNEKTKISPIFKFGELRTSRAPAALETLLLAFAYYICVVIFVMVVGE